MIAMVAAATAPTKISSLYRERMIPESKRVLSDFSKRAVERCVSQSGPLKTVRRYLRCASWNSGPTVVPRRSLVTWVGVGLG